MYRKPFEPESQIHNSNGNINSFLLTSLLEYVKPHRRSENLTTTPNNTALSVYVKASACGLGAAVHFGPQ